MRTSMIKGYISRLIPVEVMLLLYLLTTAFVIILFWSNLQSPFIHLIVRILILFLYFLAISNSNINVYKGLRIFIPFLFLPFLYGETDFFNNILFDNLDPFFSNVEFKLFGLQPSFEFSKAIPYQIFAEAMYLGYFSYYIMILGITVYAYFHSGIDIGERVGFIIITSFLIFYLFFDFFPVTGPQFYFADCMEPLPKGYFFGSSIRLIQQLGEHPTAAFPSSHVALCFILIRLSYHYTRKLFYALLVIGIILIFSTVYLRAHYVVDVIAGIITAPLVYFLAEQMFKKLSLPIRENL